MQDSEVKQQIAQMVQFINQEALEKSQEIKLKAEEEYNIEKLRMVRCLSQTYATRRWDAERPARPLAMLAGLVPSPRFPPARPPYCTGARSPPPPLPPRRAEQNMRTPPPVPVPG
jgi:hypothetical protein